MDTLKIRVECLRAAVNLVAPSLSATDMEDKGLLFQVLDIANIFEDHIHHPQRRSIGPERESLTAGETEADEDFRTRIQAAAGRQTVNQTRIQTDIGDKLDEVGDFYGVKRRGFV